MDRIKEKPRRRTEAWREDCGRLRSARAAHDDKMHRHDALVLESQLFRRVVLLKHEAGDIPADEPLHVSQRDRVIMVVEYLGHDEVAARDSVVRVHIDRLAIEITGLHTFPRNPHRIGARNIRQTRGRQYLRQLIPVQNELAMDAPYSLTVERNKRRCTIYLFANFSIWRGRWKSCSEFRPASSQ